MSVNAVSNLFHSAAAVLASPSAQLAGFDLAGLIAGKAARPDFHRAQPLGDGTGLGLLQLQERARSGALARGLGPVVKG